MTDTRKIAEEIIDCVEFWRLKDTEEMEKALQGYLNDHASKIREETVLECVKAAEEVTLNARAWSGKQIAEAIRYLIQSSEKEAKK